MIECERLGHDFDEPFVLKVKLLVELGRGEKTFSLAVVGHCLQGHFGVASLVHIDFLFFL
jgi:hypothetical protein